VIDAASYVAGPMGTSWLGDLGANVIKVEPPGKGDPMRSFGRRHRGTSVVFTNINRNKRSVQLDLKEPAGRDAFLELAAGADVLVANWRPRAMASLGLSDQQLATRNARLIRCYITGFGPSGPLADRPAFDGLLQAMSGMAHLQGADDRPKLVRTMLVDKLTAVVATQSILAALYARTRSGTGTRIDLAMLDVIAAFLYPDSFKEHTFLPEADMLPPLVARDTIVETADGAIVLSPVSGSQLRRSCDAAGHPEWKEQLKAIVDPIEMANTLLDLVESWTRSQTTAACIAAFAAVDVPVAPVLDLEQHLHDDQVTHNELYSVVDSPHQGRQRMVRHPAHFAGAELPLAPAPGAGQHQGERW
jgi:crotonobetainyl-CoA:carnitine CoA-transferase CaiB-like acyl-CoA transferase